MEVHSLVRQWQRCSLEAPPYVFPGDEFLVDEPIEDHCVVYDSFDEFVTESKDLAKTPDRRLHLGLLPIPYIGNLNRSSVFILMLNPGVRPVDYYAEHHVQEYRAAMARNLRQENADDEYPFVFLNPRFSWHSGSQYWRGRLHEIAEELVRQEAIRYQDALARLAQSVCCLQLVPYHSVSFGLPVRVIERLASVSAIVGYARSVLVPKARSGQAVIVVTRSAKYWKLPEQDRIIVYEGNETRAAYLTLETRGGEAIARHLGLE